MNMTSTFDYQKPTDEQIPRIERIREAYKTLLETIERECPASRPLSVAITNLEQSGMWAIKAIVFEGK